MVRFEYEDITKLGNIAYGHERSLPSLVRQAVREFLNKHEQKPDVTGAIITAVQEITDAELDAVIAEKEEEWSKEKGKCDYIAQSEQAWDAAIGKVAENEKQRMVLTCYEPEEYAVLVKYASMENRTVESYIGEVVRKNVGVRYAN